MQTESVSKKGKIMVKKILLGLVILAVVAPLLLVSACRHSSAEKRMAWMMKRFSRELKLTEPQKKQLDVLATELRAEGRTLWVACANTMDAMNLQLRSTEFDKEQVANAFSNIPASQEAFSALFIERLAEFHALLTPEQRAIMAQKLDKMKKYRKGRCRYLM